METRISESATRTVTIVHSKWSYAIFCFTPEGSLFIDSDWGFYGHRWRGFGDMTFVEFLISLDQDYFIKKLEINHFQETGKKIASKRKEALGELFIELQIWLKSTK